MLFDDGNELVKCHMDQCAYQYKNKCTYTYPKDTEPDSKDCAHYEPDECLSRGLNFDTMSQLFNFIDTYTNDGIDVVVLDELSLRIVSKFINCINGHTHRAFYVMSPETEADFDFLPHVDGGVLHIHKSQLDLFYH